MLPPGGAVVVTARAGDRAATSHKGDTIRIPLAVHMVVALFLLPRISVRKRAGRFSEHLDLSTALCRLQVVRVRST